MNKVILGIVIVATGFLVGWMAQERTEQRIVNRICGRAEGLMFGYQYADVKRQIKADEAASACGIVRQVTEKDYR